MKKYILSLLFTFILFSFSACQVNSTPEVAFHLDSVYLTDNELEFTFYLERSDLSMSQPESAELYTENLPEALRPVSIENDQLSCNKNFYPHVCRATLEDGLKKTGNSYNLKVEFADGAVATGVITVPYLETLDAPEILEPGDENEEKAVLKFTDTGADEYEVSAHLCYPYANDGINPCLDGDDYIVSKDEGGNFVLSSDEKFYFAEMFRRGDALEIKFDFDPEYYDSILYEVKAVRIKEQSNGVYTYQGSNAIKEVLLNVEE